jgi:hypothetical protein
VRLAARGSRDMDDGAHKVDDAAELATLRAQAQRVYLRSFAFAALLTALALLPR